MKKLFIVLIALTLISCGNSGIDVDDTKPSNVDTNSFQATGYKLTTTKISCDELMPASELSALLGEDYELTLNYEDTCIYTTNLIEDQSWLPGCQRKIQIKTFLRDSGFGNRNLRTMLDSINDCEFIDGIKDAESCYHPAFGPNEGNIEIKSGRISNGAYSRFEVQYQFIDNVWYQNSNTDNLDAEDLTSFNAYADKCPVDELRDDDAAKENLIKVSNALMDKLWD